MNKELIETAKHFSYYMYAKSNEWITLQIEGDSNYPFVKSGDKLVIHTKLNSFKLGQLILFWSEKEQRLFVHRIVRYKKNRLITKGDNNWFCDPPINHSTVVGIIRIKNTSIINYSLFSRVFLYYPLSSISYISGVVNEYMKKKKNKKFAEPLFKNHCIFYRLIISFYNNLEHIYFRRKK